MTPLAEIIEHGSLFLAALGIIGLGLLVVASLRLARAQRSRGGYLMAAGAAALLLGRLFVLVSPQVLTRDVLARLGHTFITAQAAFPVIVLTAGLAGIVWGLWYHHRWLRKNH